MTKPPALDLIPGAAVDCGFHDSDKRIVLSDQQVVDYLSHYYELVRDPGPRTCTPEYASETIRHFFDASDEVVKHANVPAPFVILQRINLGLYAVLAGLHATADWRRVAEEIWPWVSAPPSTPLGEADAAWRGAR